MIIKHICVLGGTGFVGKHLIARLVAGGKQVKVITRHRERHRELLVLPNVDLIEADIHKPDTLETHFADVDAVINLVGILNENNHTDQSFRHVHVDLARKILDACKHKRIKRLLHMSALNADAANAPSFYLRTKGEAENHLHTFSASMVHVTSFSPSVIFGQDDTFFNRFAALLKVAPLILPLAKANTKFSPIYIQDVVEEIFAALDNKTTYKQRIELCGPEIYTLKELVAFTAQCLGIRRHIMGIPDFMAKIQAVIMEYLLPGKLFTLDNLKSMQTDSICKNCDKTRISIKSIVPSYLGRSNLQHMYNRYRQSAYRK